MLVVRSARLMVVIGLRVPMHAARHAKPGARRGESLDWDGEGEQRDSNHPEKSSAHCSAIVRHSI